ncbi:MAG: hypothetical protein KDD48_08075 [Bdellovibrionales bacterium]|nr:hypothetical protein [Bdellovibrionales bacterium]
MVKYLIRLLIIVGIPIFVSLACTNQTEDLDVIDIEVVSTPTDITEILNPIVFDPRNAVGFVSNTLAGSEGLTIGLSSRVRFQVDTNYSPLLKYTLADGLVPAILPGSFSRTNAPSVTHINRLSNGKYYVVFDRAINLDNSICRLVELSLPTGSRCIDSVDKPVDWLNRASQSPKVESQRGSFVFSDNSGDIYYATLANVSQTGGNTYYLMRRSANDNLSQVSDVEISQRLAKNGNHRFYTYCKTPFTSFCEIRQDGTRVDLASSIHRVQDFHSFSSDQMMIVSDLSSILGPPTDTNLVYHMRLGFLGSLINQSNFSVDLKPNPIPGLPEATLSIEHSFKAGGAIFSFKPAARLGVINVEHQLLRLMPTFQTIPISSQFNFEWIASDLLNSNQLMVSGRTSDPLLNNWTYRSFIVNLAVQQSQQIQALNNIQVLSLRSLNSVDVLFIGLIDGQPPENTTLYKFNVVTGILTPLLTGLELTNAQLFVP